ncbi:Kinesin light chain [Lachnellula subtilissima]|uniref:Kinesin light chain n=1 Tax=Lachnellula subtilissima TaxID=602034 RepID=A0A8H8S0H0_9HELO|nr:Kinesin light chain [Lachnellula subtilissima]
MSGIEAAGLALGMISAIISIIDATNQVYEAVKDEAGLPTNFKKSATKLPLISKLLKDAERYVKAAEKATKTAFTPTLEDCKAQATQLQELFEKVVPEEGESRWDRYVKAARTIGKGGRVENLVGGILDDLQLLATRFPEVTTLRTKEQLAKAVEEVTKMEPSLPDGFEQMSAYAHYGSGAQNNNTGGGILHNNSGTGHQNSGSGFMVIGNNYNVHNYASRTMESADPHGNVYFKVPRTLNSLFTGRTELLNRMQMVLLSDTTSAKKQKRFVITGLGGQGKTDGHSFWGIFWVDIDKPSTAERDFIAAAKLLWHSTKTVPEALQAFTNTQRSWLLILDNADDPDFDYQVYFPPGNHGAVLMTSRVAECKNYSPDAFEALEGLEEKDSKNLLLKAAEVSPELRLTYEKQAEEVVRLLGSHTLALIQAGAYISQGHCQLHQYPKVYQRQRQRLLKYPLKQAQSRYRDVYATFEASADVLEQSQSESASDALRLLEILSMLDSSVLPLQIFEEGWKGSRKISQASDKLRGGIDEFSRDHVLRLPSFMDPEEDEWDPFRLTEATSILASLSLVTRHDLDGGVAISMHPLTHAWAKDRQNSKHQGAIWIATGCILGFSCFNTRFWQTQERRLLPHVLSYMDIKVNKAFDSASKEVATSIFLKFGSALSDMRQDTRLSQLIQDTFFELGQKIDEPSEDFLPLYDLQARSLIDLGRNEAARVLLEQGIRIRETTLPRTHLSTLSTISNLARVLHRQGKSADAEAIERQTLRIKEEVLGKTHPDTLASVYCLAYLLQNRQEYEEASILYERACTGYKLLLGPQHPTTKSCVKHYSNMLSSLQKAK